MKPVDVKSNTYIDSSKKLIIRILNLKIGDIVRISKYKNINVKGYTFVIKKVKNTVPWTKIQ